MKSHRIFSQHFAVCVLISLFQMFISSCSSVPLSDPGRAGQQIGNLKEGTIINIVWNRSGDKIAITNKRSAETEILVYDVSTGALRSFLSGGNILVEDWYPDDKIILFSEHIANPDHKPQPGIWTLNLANSEKEFLTLGHHATLSPDAEQLAVLNSTDQLISIALVNLNTQQEKIVFSKTGTDLSASNISWSPDSEKLLFDMHQSGDYRNDLYTLNLKTSQITQITESGYNYSGTWSPDGKIIAYIADSLEWGVSYVMLASMDQPACQAALADTERAAFATLSPQGALAYSVGGKLFYITKEAIRGVPLSQCK